MRDDLHHSVAQTSPWRAVVRVVCNEGFDGDVADALRRAARANLLWLDLKWGNQFCKALDSGKDLLFSSREHIETAIRSLEFSSPDSSARRACEIALGEIQSDKIGFDFRDHVLRTILRLSAEDCIENAAANVASKRGENQAAQLRRRLLTILQKIDILQEPKQRRREARRSVEEELEIPLTTIGL